MWNVAGHSFNPDHTYGYRIYRTREALRDALGKLYGVVLPRLAKEGLCGCVYTQLSDVEDETNGLVTFDRRVQKIRPEELAPTAEALKAE